MRKSNIPNDCYWTVPHLTDETSIPLGDKIGFEFAWLIFAMINVAFLLPMFVLRIYGSKWRSLPWQSPPTFHNDI